MKYAFAHGLTFTVGTSLTTGRSNVVTWTSIPHKTSFEGPADPHGFPDDRYLANCNDALDSLGVPDAGDCLSEPQAVTID
jgi:deltex-like protein